VDRQAKQTATTDAENVGLSTPLPHSAQPIMSPISILDLQPSLSLMSHSAAVIAEPVLAADVVVGEADPQKVHSMITMSQGSLTSIIRISFSLSAEYSW